MSLINVVHRKKDGLEFRYIAISDFYLTGDDGRQDLLSTDQESPFTSEAQSQDTQVAPEISTKSQDGALPLEDDQRDDKAPLSMNNKSRPVQHSAVGFPSTHDAKDHSIIVMLDQEGLDESERVDLIDVPDTIPTRSPSASPFPDDRQNVVEDPIQTPRYVSKRKRQTTPERGFDSDFDLQTPIKRRVTQGGTTSPPQDFLSRRLLAAETPKYAKNITFSDEFTKKRDRVTAKSRRIARTKDLPIPARHEPFSPWADKARNAGKPLRPIERPLKLSTLASVTGINCSKNKVVDILARVDSVDQSTVKPKMLPLKRDMRITDASTDKMVTISIFVDPIDCVPSAGDLVLFRNLVTHDYKGGALSAYPKYCEGKDWYLPYPSGVKGRTPELEDTMTSIIEKEKKGAG